MTAVVWAIFASIVALVLWGRWIRAANDAITAERLATTYRKQADENRDLAELWHQRQRHASTILGKIREAQHHRSPELDRYEATYAERYKQPAKPRPAPPQGSGQSTPPEMPTPPEIVVIREGSMQRRCVKCGVKTGNILHDAPGTCDRCRDRLSKIPPPPPPAKPNVTYSHH